MNGKSETVIRLLPKIQVSDSEKEDSPQRPRIYTRLINAGLALFTAATLALMLLPRIPLLQRGETATGEIVSPFTFYVEYQGPEQTVISYKVNKGEVIVEAGRKVTEKAERILQEMARMEGIGAGGRAYVGLFLIFLLLLYLFYRDIKRYKRELVGDLKRFVLLALLLIATIAVTQLSRHFFTVIAGNLTLSGSAAGFAIPVAAGAMLVCLLFDFHLALGFSFIVSIMLGVPFRDDPFMPAYYFMGSIVAALSVIQCKKRTAIIRAGAFTGLVNMIAIIGIDLFRGELLLHGGYDTAAGFFGAFVVSMLVSVSLPFFENVFDIATDIKLLELLDPNQPLLKELVYKSPGTHHHSIIIGNLAEAAAESIGENPLLARVGAYYHDVGKINKPEYFIENQRGTENKHDRLMPSMSSLIIASHVKDGVEAGHEHKLPSAVIDIIHQHHGTSLITYFYQKAKELQPFAKIAEEDYRYPGPRPRTKIAAIVMLSDAVEAASRTLDDPTPQRVQALTNSVITRIFLDDQLSKCDLTLKDLREIARSFSLVLTGIYHHRIDYPGMEFLGDKKRGEYIDKKQPDEAKAAGGKNREKTQTVAAESRDQ